MQLEIIAPDKNIYSGEVEYVNFPGIDGLFGVLKDHAPLISGLGKGEISITDNKNQTLSFAINGGVVEITNNKIMVLVE